MTVFFVLGGILLVLWISLPQTVFTAFHHVDLSRVVDDTPVFGQDDSSDSNLTSLQAWVSERVDPFAELVSQADAETQWDYNVNITDQNEEATVSGNSETVACCQGWVCIVDQLPIATISTIQYRHSVFGVAVLINSVLYRSWNQESIWSQSQCWSRINRMQ